MSDWTVGKVGPHDRAIMCGGKVKAIAEDAGTAEVIARKLNSPEWAARNAIVVLRDEVEKAIAALVVPQTGLTAGEISDSIVKARVILSDALKASVKRCEVDSAPSMVKVTVQPTGLSNIFAPRHIIQVKPGNGVTYPVPSMGVTVSVDL